MIGSVTVISNRAAVMAAVTGAKRRALEICGGKVESYAKQSCPVKTGRLRNSITHQLMDDSTELIGSNVVYAPPVELGHAQQPGRYVPAIGKRLKASHVNGKPFLRPAVENHVSEYRQICVKELGRI